MKKIILVFHLLLLIAISTNVFAQAPSNDNCTGAINVPINGQASGSTLTATYSMPGDVCLDANSGAIPDWCDDDVWYQFTANQTGNVKITISCGATFDAIAIIYSGECALNARTKVTCQDNNGPGGTEEIEVAVTNGTRYFVRIYSIGEASFRRGTFTIYVDNVVIVPPPGPPNDNCGGAYSITPGGNTLSGTTLNATRSMVDETCNGNPGGFADDDVWYKFTAGSSGNATLSFLPSGFSGTVQVYSGSCGGTFTKIACGGGNNNTVTVALANLVQNQVYYARVYSFEFGNTNHNFTISLSAITPPAPANNECSGAVAVTPGGAAVNGTTRAATQSRDPENCNGVSNAPAPVADVWYKFTPSVNGNAAVTVTPINNFDAILHVYSGSCGSLTSIGCSSSNIYNNGPETANLTGLIAGQTYYFRIYSSNNSAAGQGDFTVQVSAVFVPAANDECTGAYDLNASNNYILGNQSTASATKSYASECYNDIWYKYTATTTNPDVSIILDQTTAEWSIFTYEMGTGGFTCNGAPVPGYPIVSYNQTVDANQILGLDVVAGKTYLIRIARRACGAPAAAFRITLNHPATRPANDNCANATLVTYNSTLTNQNSNFATGSTNPAIPATGCNGDNNAGTADDDVWYKFTAGSSAGTVVRATTTNNTDFVMFVYTDCNANTQPIFCSNTAGFSETIWKKFTAGTTYYVRVYNYFAYTDPTNGLPLQFNITVKDSAFAANDEPCAAITLTYNSATPLTTTTVSSTKTTSIAREFICGTDASGNQLGTGTTGNENDVWYKFTYTPGSATTTTSPGMVIRVRTLDPANTDPVFFLYAGTDCNALTQFGCSNTAGGLENFRVRDIPAGTTSFYVRVHEYSNKPMPFIIQAKDTIFALNDRCDGLSSVAYYVPFNIGLFNQNNRNTTGPNVNQYPNNVSACTGTPSPTNYAEDDSWFRFTPLTANAYVSIQSTNNTDPVLFVYDVNPALDCRTGGVGVRSCSNAGGFTSESLFLTGLTIGKDYFIRVYEQNAGLQMNFNIYAGSSALPVSLSSFTGEHSASVNILRWTTLTEINSATFELQRSTDGRDFTTIATLNSKASGGNSSIPISYDYTDRNPAPGINYYRLKQVDKDAKSTWSSIVQLKGVTGKMLTLLGVYPNPASNAISINISSPVQQPITLIVTDIAGKIVKQQTAALPAGEKTFSMDVQALSAGSYFIKAVCKDGCQSQYLRFNKN